MLKSLYFCIFHPGTNIKGRKKSMPTTRQNKVSRLIQKELSVIFQQGGPEIHEGKMVSVTVVRVTADLSIAKVYLSIFPGKDKEETLGQIRANAHQISHVLNQKIRHQLKKMPELQFFLDDSLDYIENIENLLNR
jgi:ribosome-binding factor A